MRQSEVLALKNKPIGELSINDITALVSQVGQFYLVLESIARRGESLEALGDYRYHAEMMALQAKEAVEEYHG